MTARITAAEAKALGLDVPGGKKRTTKHTARSPYRTKCLTCGEEFDYADFNGPPPSTLPPLGL